eukprot:TRINITY_DN10347_c0_g1_i1.p1 TRINITY_DN10347_c0_g1~~TRINITY_DN10347_c0_g1_i1.p1  ORF type:complete len:478 (-),score=87.52 TRINITY_DN10347_c0_g1_i1:843-2276(-)
MMDILLEGADMLGSFVGLSGVQMRLMLCLFVSIPLALPFRFSSLGAFPRHIYSSLLGLFFLYFCFLSDALLVLALPAVAYVLLLVLPRSYSHIIILVLSFGYLSLCHIHRMIENFLEADVDFSGALMIVVLKVTSVAFDYHDGLIVGGEKKTSKGEAEMASGSLIKLPGILEFFSYNLFFPSLTCGPFFDFADYREFMKGPRPWTPQSAYGCSKLCMKKLLWTFLGLLFFVKFSFIGREWLLSNDFLVETPFHMKLFWLWIGPGIFRYRYHIVWNLADISCLLSGLSWNPAPGSQHDPNWRECGTCIDTTAIEFATSIKTFSEKWNMATSKWLKKYVYDRVPKGKRGWRKVFATLGTSALWHGFYPGYYLFFLSCGVLIILGRYYHRFSSRVIQSRTGVAKTVAIWTFNVVGFLTTSYLLCYLGIGFVVLSFSDTIRIQGSVFFFGHFVAALWATLCLVVFPFFTPSKEKLAQKKTK